MNINFNKINLAALQDMEDVCRILFPNGKRTGQEWCVGSLDGEPGSSLKINLLSGVWKDFSLGPGGPDPISLVAAFYGISQGDAAKKLDYMLNAGGVNVAPLRKKATDRQRKPQFIYAPAEPSESDLTHPQLGTPSQHWTYKSADGQTIGAVVRFDLSDGEKTIRYRTWNGKSWEWKGFPHPRPLFGLDELKKRPDATVLVVEGEKTAVTGALVFPEFVVITWPGGSKAVSKADWTPLNGRRVIVWPDADDTGRDAMREIADALGQIEAVDTSDFPNKWDLADPLPEGWTHDKVRQKIEGSTLVSGRHSRSKLVLPERGEFPLDAFPPVLRDYASSLASVRKIPVELPLLCCLGTISGAMGKGWELHGAVNGQKNRGNIFLILGLPPGTGKGIANLIIKPILEYERYLTEQWNTAERPRLEAERHLADFELKRVNPGKNKPFDKQSLIDATRALSEAEARLRHSPALIGGNATTSGLARELTRVTSETLFICSAEGGEIVRVMLGSYRQDGGDFELWLNGYSGEGYKQTRGSQTSGALDIVSLKDICLSCLLMVQPSVMAEVLASKEARERGLVTRILPVRIDVPPVLDDGIPLQLQEGVEEEWQDLGRWILIRRFGKEAPYRIDCSEEARNLFTKHHNEAQSWIMSELADCRVDLSRWRENALRIATVLAVAENPEVTIITEDVAARAIRIHRWIALGALQETAFDRDDQLNTRADKLAEVLSHCGGSRLVSELWNLNKFPLNELIQLTTYFPHRFEMETIINGGRPGQWVRLLE
jgi:hypothetical protein